MSQSIYGKIGIAALIMMASIFLSRVAGVFREMVIANVAGADAAVDAYRLAFVLPEILNHILASGFMSVTFIPIFSRYLLRGDEAGGWRIFSTILTLFGLLLALLIICAMLFAHHIVPLLAPGRSDPQFLALAVRMTRITLPAQFFFFAGGMLMAVQFAKKRFLIPALAPIIYNLGIIAGGLILGPRRGVEGFAWGALAGAFAANFAIQVMGAHRAGMHYRPNWDYGHSDLKRYVLLTLPLIIGLTMVFSTEIFSKLFGSFLPGGAIAWIDYAVRIMMLLVAFFGQAVGVASYPDMARLATERRLADLNRLFNRTLRYLSLVLPVSILVLVVRHEILRLLFERGRFSTQDTAMTALALTGLLPGAVAFAAQTVVNRGFYAISNTMLPAVYGTLAVIISLPIYWVGVKTFGVLGIGLAISFSAILQVGVLFTIWNRRSANVQAHTVYRSYLNTALATVPMAVILWFAHGELIQWIDNSTKAGAMGSIIAMALLFAAMMTVWGWLFKVEELGHLWRRLVRRAAGPEPGR